MFSRIVVTALVALALAVPASTFACGDKFLVPSRGARFKSKVDRASAAVLVYARPGTALDEALRALPIEARLRAAGYRPTVVGDRQALERAFGARSWDVVVLDLVDAPDVGAEPSTLSPPVVLPVAGQVARTTLVEAKRRYRQVLKVPGKHHAFIQALDDAVVARARARARSTARTGE